MARSRRQTTGRDLSAAEAFLGLVDHGLFSEKLPPCFTSEGLSQHVPASIRPLETETDRKKVWDLLSGAKHDYIPHATLRDTNVPRLMGVPHPKSYLAQCLAIKRHWPQIRSHCAKPPQPVSRVFVRRTAGKRVFRMNYQGRERSDNSERTLRMMTGATHVAHADIATCFQSIYTHSVAWALHGRDRAKKHRSELNAGNVLDRASQCTRHGQTNGLLIGPHSSNVIAEIILTRIDRSLLDRKYVNLVRHIDDYTFYATSHGEAEGFLRDLALELRKFDLVLNTRKTAVREMPQPFETEWIRELKSFRFASRGRIRTGTTGFLLDLALKLARTADTSAVLNYAIKMVPSRLEPRARALFVRQGVNLALQYPYLAWILDEHLFEKHAYDGICDVVQEFSSRLLRIASDRLYPDAACHALHLALKYGTKLTSLDEHMEGALVEMNDCLSDVLLLHYASRHGLRGLRDRIRRRASKLKGLSQQDKDQSWLLIYQLWRESTLRREGQDFLADLKGKRFRFLVA